MSEFEVAEPILNSPFEEPQHYWYIREGETPEKRDGRRPSFVFPPRDQTVPWSADGIVLRPSALYPTFISAPGQQVTEKVFPIDANVL